MCIFIFFIFIIIIIFQNNFIIKKKIKHFIFYKIKTIIFKIFNLNIAYFLNFYNFLFIFLIKQFLFKAEFH